MSGWNPGMLNFSGAGGFVPDANVFGSPTSATKKTVKRLQNIVPIFIRQVKSHSGEEFKMFGASVQIISLVGMVKEIEMQSTNATYTVADISGTIKAVYWIDTDSNDDIPKITAAKEGSYVQIFGTVRTQNGEKIIMILKLIPIDNCNIITTHYLEVIHTVLQAKAMSLDLHKKIIQNNPGDQLAKLMSIYEENKTDTKQLPFTPLQKRVFEVFRTDSSRNSVSGIDRETILRKFPTNQKNEINEALEFLVSEGHIYSTVDSEHFQATDA